MNISPRNRAVSAVYSFSITVVRVGKNTISKPIPKSQISEISNQSSDRYQETPRPTYQLQETSLQFLNPTRSRSPNSSHPQSPTSPNPFKKKSHITPPSVTPDPPTPHRNHQLASVPRARQSSSCISSPVSASTIGQKHLVDGTRARPCRSVLSDEENLSFRRLPGVNATSAD